MARSSIFAGSAIISRPRMIRCVSRRSWPSRCRTFSSLTEEPSEPTPDEPMSYGTNALAAQCTDAGGHGAAERKSDNVEAGGRADDVVDAVGDDARDRFGVVAVRWEIRLAEAGQIGHQDPVGFDQHRNVLHPVPPRTGTTVEQHDDRRAAIGFIPQMPDHPSITARGFIPRGLALQLVEHGLRIRHHRVIHRSLVGHGPGSLQTPAAITKSANGTEFGDPQDHPVRIGPAGQTFKPHRPMTFRFGNFRLDGAGLRKQTISIVGQQRFRQPQQCRQRRQRAADDQRGRGNFARSIFIA